MIQDTKKQHYVESSQTFGIKLEYIRMYIWEGSSHDLFHDAKPMAIFWAKIYGGYVSPPKCSLTGKKTIGRADIEYGSAATEFVYIQTRPYKFGVIATWREDARSQLKPMMPVRDCLDKGADFIWCHDSTPALGR